jgi:hypothetical protein
VYRQVGGRMRFRVVALPVAVATLLGGCVFSPGAINAPRVDPDDVEQLAADALEDETGQRPDIDCGVDPIYLVEGKEISCLLTDTVAGLEFDTIVTFASVSSSGDYTIDITVADVPNNAPEPTVEPEPGGETPTVSGADIAALAIVALTPELGFVPEITCDYDVVEIVVGNVVDCFYVTDGGIQSVDVHITQFDGETYTINAVVLD